ncbi:MAG: extracellular solute-binding protein, partial [Leifsonia flava]
MSQRAPRALIAAAAFATASILVGCAGTPASEAPAADGPYTAPKSDVTAEITVSNWGDPGDKKIYDEVASRFAEEYPNVKVNNDFTPITTWTEYVNKLVSSVAAGNAPDVINIATEGVELGLYNDLFAPLDGYLENDPDGSSLTESMDPQLMDGFAKDGKQYLIPNTWNTMLMYYNTKMFADAG